MKKLAIVHSAYWEQAFGGAELQISYLAEYVRSKGWEVHYVFEDKNTPIKNPNSIHLHPIKAITLRNTFGSRFVMYRKKVTCTLEEINPDVIYTRAGYSWSGIVSSYSKKNKKKHIWALASDKDPIQKIKFIDILKPLNIFEKYWIKYAIKNSTTIICQNAIQQMLLQMHHNRQSLHISQMANEEEGIIEKDYSKLKILWIANLKPIKRPEIFIQLSTNFANRNAEFIMVGKISKEYETLIEKSKNLQYLGNATNHIINKLLCESHLLINTSISEGFSNTFVQAWLRKVPVISMNSNPDEILTNQNIGKICKTEDQLKLTIDEIISNPGLLKEMGERAYIYAKNNHSTHMLLPKVFELFEMTP